MKKLPQWRVTLERVATQRTVIITRGVTAKAAMDSAFDLAKEDGLAWETVSVSQTIARTEQVGKGPQERTEP